MITLGIVGGMGSGKSWVSNYLAQKGCCVFDADRLAQKILHYPIVTQQIRSRWAIDKDDCISREGLPKLKMSVTHGVLSPQAVSAVVFNSVTELRFLEKVMKPHLDLELKSFLSSLAVDYIPIAIIDAPLLYEIGWAGFCNKVLFVDAPLETRVSRIAWRRKETIEESFNTIKLREACLAISLEEKKRLADYVFINEESTDQLDDFFDELKDLSCSLNPNNKY